MTVIENHKGVKMDCCLRTPVGEYSETAWLDMYLYLLVLSCLHMSVEGPVEVSQMMHKKYLVDSVVRGL